MGTISSAFGIISGALDADQSALSVVANNVANANTTGYAQETPNWQENAPIMVNGITIGDGVAETGATSQRDRVLEDRLDQQQQLASASSTRLSALNEMQALFTPDSGSSSSTSGDIGSDITGFFNAFSSLESDPTDNALRESVLSSATTLAGDISGTAASLNSQRTAIDQEATDIAGQVNSLTSALAQVNQQIQSTSPDGDAGTLEDERQQDLSQLSQLVGINQVTTSENGLEITTTSGQLLVSNSQSYQLTTGSVNGVTDFFLAGNDITSGLTAGGGQPGGYLAARDQDIPNALNSLDQLAYSVAKTVNAANNSGTDLDGNEGTGTNAAGVTGNGTAPLYIFTEPAQVAGSAAAMTVTMTNPNQIAAAGLGDGTGDNSNATTMASIASQQTVNGQTPIDYYSNLVTNLGSTVSEVQTENTAQNASVTQLQKQNNALSSVNLNDEASAMSTLETSYQAASQVFNMLNTVMTSALNLGVQTAVS
jgi:flagellar hook-associated protein 1 FlgK